MPNTQKVQSQIYVMVGDTVGPNTAKLEAPLKKEWDTKYPAYNINFQKYSLFRIITFQLCFMNQLYWYLPGSNSTFINFLKYPYYMK